MKATLTLDKAGRVVIPKRTREKMGLSAGDSFNIECNGEELVLKPVRQQGSFKREKGFWVFRTGKKLTVSETDAVVQSIRDERDSINLGLK